MEIKCPSCYAYLDDDEDLALGEIVYCSKCFQDFEVMKIRPVKLKSIKSWSSEEEDLEEAYND